MWHAAAGLEGEERLLLNGEGEIAMAERVKAVIRAKGGVVTPYFDERLHMHRSAESVEDEMRRTVGRILGEGDPDVEIKEVRTGIEGIHRFQVTVKRPELTDGTTRETGGN